VVTLIRGGSIITANQRGDILPGGSLLIEGDRIAAVFGPDADIETSPSEIVDASRFVIIPGFIQTHVHLCQTLFRGMADDLQLLDWLGKKIFPLEAAHDERSIYFSALRGIAELFRSGTTTIMDMGSVNHEEELIKAMGETGLRAFAGKAMMDINDIYPRLKESSHESLKSTLGLAEKWHGSYEGRIKYAVAPRFVLSCSDRLMRDAYEMTTGFGGMLFHTHASENRDEMQAVRERCGMGNIEFLNHLGVLSEKTCLAHCIHVSEKEIGLLQSTKTNVAHCPSSNLKLGSGIADIPAFIGKRINVTLGADGAPCNNTLDIFQEMRLTSLLQKPFHGPESMPARSVFEMATLCGAKALGLDKEIGSIEAGKKADIVLLDLEKVWNPDARGEDLYASIVYSGGPENVDSVMVNGKWVYRKREFTGIDEERIVFDSKEELRKLINRL